MSWKDDRMREADIALEAALKQLVRGVFDPKHVAAILDSARDEIVALVEDFKPPYRRWVNELDAARQYINRAIRLVDLGWASSEAEQFIAAARRHLGLANETETPGGGAA